MTKIEALKKTKAIWVELSRTGNTNKKTAYKSLGLSKDYRDCACCEYVGENSELCEECPLWGYWTGKKPIIFASCCESPSPYNDWIMTGEKSECQKHARAIVALCDKAIEETEKWI